MQILYEYMKDIGADASLLSASSDTEVERERNQAVFNKWFQTIVVQNNRFPQDIPITLVLRHFSRMVVQNKVQIKGYNLREQVRAFHTYLDNWEHELRGKWWQYQNPGDRPKPLPAFASVSTQEQAQSDEERGQMIHKMYGAEDVPESLQKFTNS